MWVSPPHAPSYLAAWLLQSPTIDFAFTPTIGAASTVTVGDHQYMLYNFTFDRLHPNRRRAFTVTGQTDAEIILVGGGGSGGDNDGAGRTAVTPPILKVVMWRRLSRVCGSAHKTRTRDAALSIAACGNSSVRMRIPPAYHRLVLSHSPSAS